MPSSGTSLCSATVYEPERQLDRRPNRCLRGDIRLTMNGEEGARVTKTLGIKHAYPAHFEGWLHYKQGRAGIEADFEAAEVKDRLHFLDPGESAQPQV